MAQPLSFYTAPEHEPFLWHAGENAALLVHGFPGTPSEVRPIATALHEAGWTVQGLLLPGFAGEFASLPQKTHEEWLRAVEDALAGLHAAQRRVILVGNSMGSALCLKAAVDNPTCVDGMALFAPFWRVSSRALDAAYPLVAPFLPTIRPFSRANFDDERVRDSLRRFLDGVDLDDPETRRQVRGLSLPVHALGQVRRTGKQAFAASSQVDAPVLIFQGTRDVLATPAMTRTLARRLPSLVGYVEIDSDHELAHMRTPQERTLLPLLVDFAQAVAAGRFRRAASPHAG